MKLKSFTNFTFPKKSICIICGKYTYSFYGVINAIVRNTTYDNIRCFCKKCHNEKDVPGLWDENQERLNKALKDKSNEL